MDEDLAEHEQCAESSKKHQAWLEHGMQIATQIAALDIGQGVVVRKGTVLAVEASKVQTQCLNELQFKTKEAIFVKTVKPNQDYRFDVPVLTALGKLAQAKILTAAVAVNSIILIEKEQLMKDAKIKALVS